MARGRPLAGGRRRATVVVRLRMPTPALARAVAEAAGGTPTARGREVRLEVSGRTLSEVRGPADAFLKAAADSTRRAPAAGRRPK